MVGGATGKDMGTGNALRFDQVWIHFNFRSRLKKNRNRDVTANGTFACCAN